MRSRMASAVHLLAVALLLIISLLMPLHLPVASAARADPHVAVLKGDDGMDFTLGDMRPAAADSGANPGHRGLAARTVEMRASTAKHRGDEAAAKMYGMLTRDYASKARRRSPINNGEPLQEEDEP